MVEVKKRRSGRMASERRSTTAGVESGFRRDQQVKGEQTSETHKHRQTDRHTHKQTRTHTRARATFRSEPAVGDERLGKGGAGDC